MLVRLFVIRGKANKKAVAVALPAVIGRSREADLTIIHPMISRRHCQLFESDGLVKVRDLGSLNGTYLGGEQVQEAFLPPGAILTVGPLVFRVEYEASPAAISREPSVCTTRPPESPKDDILVMDEHTGGSDNDSQRTGGITSQAEAEISAEHWEPPTEPCSPLLSEKEADSGGEACPEGRPLRAIAPPDGAMPNFSALQGAVNPPGAAVGNAGREILSEPEQRNSSSAALGACADEPPQEARDEEPDSDRWADIPPPFTVVRQSGETPVAPVLLNSTEDDCTSSHTRPTGSAVHASDAASVAHQVNTETVKNKKRRGWWFFRR
ncbi:MAG: FHA domain-containing protein [Thermogutta sp.]